MPQTISITLDELDSIFISLEKANAIVQLISECEAERKNMTTSLADGSWFLVMQIAVEELDKITKFLKNCEPLGKKEAHQADNGSG